VLDEVQLLVAGLDGEIIALRGLVGALGAEGRVGENTIEALPPVGLVDSIPQGDFSLNAVEEKIHEGEASGSGDEVLAIVRAGLDAEDVLAVKSAFCLLHEPFVGAHEEAAGAARGVADREVGCLPWVGLHDTYDGLDKDARREILPCAFLALACCLLQKAFKGGAFHVDIEGGPFFLINHGNDALEVDGIVEARHALREDIAQEAFALAEGAKGVRIMVGELRAAEGFEALPVAPFGDLYLAFRGHFEEEEVGELFDVVPVVYAIVAEDVAKAPKFIDNIGHGCCLVVRRLLPR
jgi:hypothetical protein